MTDKEELIALLTRWGVPFTEECQAFSGGWASGIDSGIRVTSDPPLAYREGERLRPKNWGYEGFFTEFYFDEDGSFTAMGAWE